RGIGYPQLAVDAVAVTDRRRGAIVLQLEPAVGLRRHRQHVLAIARFQAQLDRAGRRGPQPECDLFVTGDGRTERHHVAPPHGHALGLLKTSRTTERPSRGSAVPAWKNSCGGIPPSALVSTTACHRTGASPGSEKSIFSWWALNRTTRSSSSTGWPRLSRSVMPRPSRKTPRQRAKDWFHSSS